MSAPRLSVFIAASLDGFIARPDGSIDFLSRVEAAGEDYGYASFFASIDALVVGRKTYETALSFDAWPYAGKRVFVLTHGARSARHDERFLAGTPLEIVAELAREGVAHAYLDGGDVIRRFLGAGLVSELTLSIVPVLLGGGVALFGALAADLPLQLVTSRSYPSGLVQLIYHPHRAGL